MDSIEANDVNRGLRANPMARLSRPTVCTERTERVAWRYASVRPIDVRARSQAIGRDDRRGPPLGAASPLLALDVRRTRIAPLPASGVSSPQATDVLRGSRGAPAASARTYWHCDPFNDVDAASPDRGPAFASSATLDGRTPGRSTSRLHEVTLSKADELVTRPGRSRRHGWYMRATDSNLDENFARHDQRRADGRTWSSWTRHGRPITGARAPRQLASCQRRDCPRPVG